MTIPAPSVGVQPDAPISAPGYAIAPNAVIRDARLSRDARLLYVLLDGHAGKSGRVRVGDAVLAAELGVSERTLYRYLDELKEAQLITRKGTGRSAITTVANGIRTGGSSKARTVSPDTAELSPVSPLQRSSSREVINSKGPGHAEGSKAPAPTARPAAGSHAEKLLYAVREASGAPVDMVPRVRRDLEKIAARGIQPAELAVEVAAWMAVKEADVIRPAGFIVGVVLPAIARGSEVPSAEPLLQTPTPPSIRELYSADPCQHGDPRGASSCALCRHATKGVPA